MGKKSNRHGGSSGKDKKDKQYKDPPAPEQPLDDDLGLLGPLARDFFKFFPKYATLDSFLATLTLVLAKKLIKFMIKQHGIKWKMSTAEVYVGEWKTNVRQRIENRKEGRCGLHSALQVFTPTVLDFLASRSIRTPTDLLECSASAEAQVYGDWRKAKHLKAIKFHSARSMVNKWKKTVKSQYTEAELGQMNRGSQTTGETNPSPESDSRESGGESDGSSPAAATTTTPTRARPSRRAVAKRTPHSYSSDEESIPSTEELGEEDSVLGETESACSSSNSKDEDSSGSLADDGAPAAKKARLNEPEAEPVPRKPFVYHARIALSLLTEERLRGHFL